MTRILVTGGSGFIGTYVVSRLRELSEFDVDVLGEAGLSNIRLGQSNSLLQLMTNQPRYDVVINLAAYIGNEPENITASNFHGVHDILDFCNNTGVEKLLHLSRSFSVKKSNSNERSTRLSRLYEYSKQYGELLLNEYSTVSTSIFRITAPVWSTMPMERYLSQILVSIVNQKPVQIYGRGRRIQNYVRLDDIGDAIVTAIKPSFIHTDAPLLVCGPENFTDFSFAEEVYKRLGQPFYYEFISPEIGFEVDESDYGIDLTQHQSSYVNSRAIDFDFLKEHLGVVTGKMMQASH
jgi:nucleoside-diphosphate-sugar epimerase